MNVSVLILTYNEEINIDRCLRSVEWCDDIVIIDSGSSDRTIEIARGYKAKILKRPFKDFASQRNYGLDTVDWEYPWILHLDADEELTPEFKQALDDVKPSDELLGYRVASKTIFFGRWLRFAGMYPAYQVRLTRLGYMRFIQRGHGQQEDCPAHLLGTFPEPYLHFPFSKGLRHWFERHARYAEAEAKEVINNRHAGSRSSFFGLLSRDRVTRRRVSKRLANFLPLYSRPFARFFYVYIFKFGILDGRLGFRFAVMMGVFEYMICSIVRDLEYNSPKVDLQAKSNQPQTKY